MKALHPHTLGIVPLYAMKGLRPPLQVVLAWIWNAELTGEQWTMKWLGEMAGMTNIKKALDELQEIGVVFPNGQKKAPYSVVVDFIPEREAAKEPEKKKAEPYAEWVFNAMKVWTEGRGGVVGPKDMHACLHLAVAVQGEEVVLGVFKRYAKEGDARFDTLKRFAENMGRYKRKQATLPTSRGFGE